MEVIILNCPKCNSVMKDGFFELSGTILGFLFFGLSFKHLYFNHNNEQTKLIDNNDKIKGYYCNRCNLSIYSHKYIESSKYNKTCRKCGTDNMHGGNKCIGCGSQRPPPEVGA
jgi:hypothetical protein